MMKADGEFRKIRILLADDHTLWRQGVRDALNREEDIEVVAEAGGGKTALAHFCSFRPDITLLDLSMPGMGGLEALRQIRSFDPEACVVILSAYETDEDIDLSLRAGARGYLLKDVDANELTRAIREVQSGKTRVAPSIASKLAERVTGVQLSMRELAVLRLIAQGRANKEIAGSLFISEGTVKAHVANLFDKLKVASRTEAVAQGVRRGLVRMG